MKHGTHSGYVKGCRCIACTRARRNYMANHRPPKLLPARRTRAMFRCLKSRGASGKRIYAVTGVSSLQSVERRIAVRPETQAAMERLHWHAWLASYEMRRTCECEMPAWVREKLEVAA